MPLPLLPLAIGLVVVAAASGGGRKKRGTPVSSTFDVTPHGGLANVDYSDAPAQTYPGMACALGDNTIFAAYDDFGECQPFWFWPDTDNFLAGAILSQWEARGFPVEACSPGGLADPGTFLERWYDNPVLTEIVVAALHQAYPGQPARTWPPLEIGDPVGDPFDPMFEHPDTPYWVFLTWKLAWAVALRELCGYEMEA